MNLESEETLPNSANHSSSRLHLIIAIIVIINLLLFFSDSVMGQENQLPDDPPDAAAGLIPYVDRCVNCHGNTGQGDGELAADLPNPPTAHASPEYMRQAVPTEMFDVITSGRVAQGMPPFGPESSDPLSDMSRWDLIAAIYSFGTPVESVQEGQLLYEENCLACHGEFGEGDGPEVQESANDGGDLSSIDYWFNRSNQSIFDKLMAQDVPDHEYELDEDSLWSVIDFMRTFSYGHTDALARYRPLEQATVSGQVINGTTGETVTTANTVLLRAFTVDLNITLELEDTLDEDGFYNFELTDVPQDWFFRVSVSYDDLDFGSDFGQLTFDQSALDLPITVYDSASDPSAISIEQLHVVLGFDGERVLVSEVYIASNNNSTVYVGESGDRTKGTFELFLPEGAQEVTFQRGFGSIDSFIPAEEVIQTDSGWADTLPLRPGSGALTLFALYALPYEEGEIISHPVIYDTNRVNLVISDPAVSVEGDNWQSGGMQAMETGTVNTYGQGNLAAGSELVLKLSGEPSLSTDAGSNVIRDNSTELLVGLGVALLVLVIAAGVIRQWRQEPEVTYSREELLQELADLDDAYEAGEIDEADYQSERELIKADLIAIWDDDSSD